jgi:hypothetical protein
LKTQIIQILTTQTTNKSSNLATAMMNDSEEYEKCVLLLKAILEEIKDKIKNPLFYNYWRLVYKL